MNFSFWLEQKEYRINLEERAKNNLCVSVNEQGFDVSVEFIGKNELLLKINGRVYNVVVNSNSLSHSVYVNGRLFKIEKRLALEILKGEKGRSKKREVKISMPGRVVQIIAREGEEVQEGQAVLVLEAMKMQNEIKSPQAGKISQIRFRAGDYVEAGAILFAVE
jgi:biotin carboxyl carrier protein